MKKLFFVITLLSFFACTEKRGNETNYTSGDTFDSYEFVFRNPAIDSIAIIESGYVYGDYVPVECIGERIVVPPDKFIRFYDDVGNALILTEEFVSGQIKYCENAVCVDTLFGHRIYLVAYLGEDFGLMFYKWPGDDAIHSALVEVDGKLFYSDDEKDLKLIENLTHEVSNRIDELDVLIDEWMDYLDSLDEYEGEEEPSEEEFILI